MYRAPCKDVSTSACTGAPCKDVSTSVCTGAPCKDVSTSACTELHVRMLVPVHVQGLHVGMLGKLFHHSVLCPLDAAGSGNTLAPTLHDVTPTASSQRYNVAQYNGSAVSSDTVVPKAALTKVHGILMLIAWPLLGLTGIFFAAWMKPALGPPPMPPKWFTVSSRPEE